MTDVKVIEGSRSFQSPKTSSLICHVEALRSNEFHCAICMAMPIAANSQLRLAAHVGKNDEEGAHGLLVKVQERMAQPEDPLYADRGGPQQLGAPWPWSRRAVILVRQSSWRGVLRSPSRTNW